MAKPTTGRGMAITAAALIALTVGCSATDSGRSGAVVDESADVTAASDAGSTVGDVAADAIADATRALCATERRTLEVAIDAYTAMTGSTPVSVDEMVGEFLREAPGELDIGPDGAIRAIAGGRCA
jgi:hypothetical protein